MKATTIERRWLTGRLDHIYQSFLPMEFRPVVAGVAALAAEDGGYEFHPDPLLGPAFEQLVSRLQTVIRAHHQNAAAVIKDGLDFLQRFRFVVFLESGVMRLCIQGRKVAQAAAGPAGDGEAAYRKKLKGMFDNLASLGNPGTLSAAEYQERRRQKAAETEARIAELGARRTGESEVDYYTRILLAFGKALPARDTVQPQLPMPLPGGRAEGVAKTIVPVADVARADLVVVGGTENLAEPDTKPPAPSPSHPSPPTPSGLETGSTQVQKEQLAAAANESSINPLAAAASENPPPHEAATLRTLNPNQMRNPNPTPGSTIFEETVLSPAAKRLASLAIRLMHYKGRSLEIAPAVMQGYLDQGYREDLIDAVIREPGSKGHHSPVWLKDRLASKARKLASEQAGAPLSAQPGATNPQQAKVRHPRIEAVQDLKDRPAEEQFELEYFAKALDESDPVKRRRTIVLWKNSHERAFSVVAKHYPELYDAIDECRPGETRTQQEQRIARQRDAQQRDAS